MHKTANKLLATLLALVMVVSVMSVGALAADTAPSNVAVYVYKTETDYAIHELGTLTAGATALTALNTADSSVNYKDSTNGAWLYTVNGKLATVAAEDYKVQDGDFLAFYQVPNYTEDSLLAPSYYTDVVDENGRLIVNTERNNLANTVGLEVSLDFTRSTAKYTTVSSNYVAKTTSNVEDDGYMYITATADDHNILRTCYPVKKVTLNDWYGQVLQQALNLQTVCNGISANEIGETAKNTLTSKTNAALAQRGQASRFMYAFTEWEKTFAALDYTTDARLDYVTFTGDIAVTDPFYPYTTAYTVQSTSVDPTAVPTSFAMDITPMDSSATVTVSGSDGVTVKANGTNSKIITLPENATSTLTVTVTKGSVSKEYTFTLTTPAPVAASASIYAFLPAPGQFTNENVTTGGWGDAYDANGELKVNNSTGMSLGYFGGYVVYKFDKAVENKATNPYGADFIVYGNAFWGNSEPGCIQVSQDGENWFDIAGSRYYNDDTVKNFSLTYKNPDVDEDAGITAAASNLGTWADVTYTGSETGTIAKNAYHKHSWFPLNANYFTGRYGNTALDKVSELPFASREVNSNGITSYLTLSGVKLGNVSTSDTAGYGFGYCDVHPNKELGGSVAYNPYQSFTSSSDYSTKTEGTSGGDPIDISWAVKADGTPAGLTSIQYVRIYTGAAQMNGIFGEISTEALGVAACTGTGSTSIKTPTITVGGNNLADVADESEQIGNMGTVDVTGIEADSVVIGATGTTYTCINGVSGTSQTIDLSDGAVHLVQIIAQDGTASPYVTVLRLQK